MMLSISQDILRKVPTGKTSRHACLCGRLQRCTVRIPRHVARECHRRTDISARHGTSSVYLLEEASSNGWSKIVTALAVVQIALLPLTGSSLAELDTATEPAGVGAVVEGSDISNEDQKTVLAKLREKILPEAKEILGRVGKGEGSNYPSSIAKELETVELEVNDLIEQANKGGDMSNIKSAASGIEQQVNALKAIVGFD